MKTYKDKVSQKVISYDDDSLFTIETRTKFNSRTIRKVFNSEDVDQAFREFYEMSVREGDYKYLYLRPFKKQVTHETLILRMKGYATEIAINNLVLKDKKPKTHISTKSIIGLTNCPASLAHKLFKEDRKSYPASMSKWTYSKIFYSLLSYMLSLPREERNELLRKADSLYQLERESSGYSIEEDSRIKVDVVAMDDLL